MKTNTVRRREFGIGLAAVATAGLSRAQQADKPAVSLSGVWLTPTVGRGRQQSQWVDGPLPFTPKGQAAFGANKPGKGPRQIAPAQGNDPIGGANPPGLYRTLLYNRPFELVQLPDKVIQLFEWGRVWRAIYTDGRPVPDDIPAGPYWYGYSVGKWEGETLAVTTMALDERAWFDEWGTPISGDAKVEEHWRRTAADKLEVRLTLHDATYYSKPWTSAPVVFTLQHGVEPQEIIFSPMDEAVFNERIRNVAGTPAK